MRRPANRGLFSHSTTIRPSHSCDQTTPGDDIWPRAELAEDIEDRNTQTGECSVQAAFPHSALSPQLCLGLPENCQYRLENLHIATQCEGGSAQSHAASAAPASKQ